MLAQEAREPACQARRVDGPAIPFGKQQIIVHRLAHDLHCAPPFGADAQPLTKLPLLIIFQELHRVFIQLDDAAALFCFGCGEQQPLPRNGGQGPIDGQHPGGQVDVRPPQPAKFTPAAAREQRKLHDHAVLRWGIRQGCQQFANSLFVQVLYIRRFHFRRVHAGAGVLWHELPPNRRIEHAGQQPVIMPGTVAG